ncbi:hypothetical protein L484_012302 [Morus notabilis]|uniref:Uncharacterized protein n=1 Tax=Morus notabilis TaxID=981085 RepID=W9QJB6_9ROSA|nr:hypothetical protein L484_012302 [Morus notabilis]
MGLVNCEQREVAKRSWRLCACVHKSIGAASHGNRHAGWRLTPASDAPDLASVMHVR